MTLIEQDFALGGALLAEPADSEAAGWIASMRAELAAAPNVTLRPRTTAFGLYDGNMLGLVEQRANPRGGAPALVLLRAGAIVFCHRRHRAAAALREQ